jgi:thymidylate kinase
MFNVKPFLDNLRIKFFTHNKRGSEYANLFTGSVQDASGLGLQEGDTAEVYVDKDNKVWIRKTDEFNDGRFSQQGLNSTDPFDNPLITQWLLNPSKITIFEGPDSSGKTTLIDKICTYFKDTDYKVHRLSFPGNRADLNLRDLILKSDMSKNRLGSVFLFLADFTHTFETEIKPYLDDPKVIFICDRLFSSTLVYQNCTINWLNRIFQYNHTFSEFVKVLGEAKYFYLAPNLDNLTAHMERINNKKLANDTNSYDPVNYNDIIKNIMDYNHISTQQTEQGILGSFDVNILKV